MTLGAICKSAARLEHAMDDDAVLQPFTKAGDQVIPGPEAKAKFHEYIGILIDESARSAVIMLYDHPIMNEHNDVIDCILLPEKDIARTIDSLKHILQYLRSLPIE
jgi:hypothetical protein